MIAAVRPIAIAYLLCSLVVTSACHTYRAATATAPVNAMVRVRFDQPREIVVESPRADPVRILGVTEVKGRALALRGDTVLLELRRVRVGRQSGPHLSPMATVAVIPDPARPVEVRRLSYGRTAIGLVGTAGVAFSLLIVVLFAGSS